MKARKHTAAMLGWWIGAGVRMADVAVRRSSGAMIWHQNIDLSELPLAWLGRENAHHADVYVRPARYAAAPVVFLDDVAPALAARIAKKYSTLVVETSTAGGCHVWLACERYLTERERALAQRWLAKRTAADRASTSGEHLGRLAGFKNWKRGGNWINVLDASRTGRTWQPVLADDEDQALPPSSFRKPPHTPLQQEVLESTDQSPSGRDWAWVCGALERGKDPERVKDRLLNRVTPRRGKDAERYATRTVRRALGHIELKRSVAFGRPS